MGNTFHFRNISLKLIFPLIYAVLFIVQCVCNFDTISYNGTEKFQVKQISSEKGRHITFFEKSKSGRPLKLKFHLNKRFQPAFISQIPDMPDAQVIVFETLQQQPYSSPFIESSLSDTRSLRGPPAVS